MKEFDAFISHASEDKRCFVRPLAQKLSEYGARVWYDELSLKPGVSLSRSIEQGLSKSSFGLVVLSDAFFNKKWTEYELRALNSYEVHNPGIIIPVWYKVDIEAVRKFSPYLSDKLAIVYDRKSIDDVVIEILEVIREDLFEEVLRKRAWYESLKNAEIKTMTTEEAKKIKIAPIRHETLPLDLLIRIRSIRLALFEVYPHSFDFWVNGFQRDTHPENEIHAWEKIATSYSEANFALRLDTVEKKNETFNLVLGLFSAVQVEYVDYKNLSQKEFDTILDICKSPFPIYDIEDKKFGE